jgi:plastocyanin
MKRSIMRVAVLAMAAVLAAGVLSACGGTQKSGTVTVTIKDLRFNPGTLTVTEGTTVRWLNEDTTAHTSTSADYSADATTQPEGAWNSKVMNPGDSWEHTFDKAGKYDYACAIHPYLKGTIEVTKK